MSMGLRFILFIYCASILSSKIVHEYYIMFMLKFGVHNVLMPSYF